jgi:hypothetical protein
MQDQFQSDEIIPVFTDRIKLAGGSQLATLNRLWVYELQGYYTANKAGINETGT